MIFRNNDAMRKIFLALINAMRYIGITMERIIKKYDNRKLYDTSQSKYVSLRELKEVIRKGETVTIVEQKSGRDITSEVLTKAILEDTQDERDTITPGTLHELIRWGSNTLEAGLSRVGRGLNKVLPIAGVDDIKSLQDHIKELEDKVNMLQNRLNEHDSSEKNT